MNPFDWINSISQNKKDLMSNTANDVLAEKEYPAYFINKGLSYYPDTILHANEMNVHHHLDNRLQYSYFLNSIRPMRRMARWAKKEDSNDIEIIKEYYKVSGAKASTMLSLLSSDQLNSIKEELQKGGLDESSRRFSGGKTSKAR